jgi:fatty-acyl-CoA synthase
MPDEKWGERPKAFVELKDGEHASAEDILAFAKEHLRLHAAGHDRRIG